MDTQQAVAETAPHEAAGDGAEARRDGGNKFTLAPGDSLEGKLTYSGSISVQGRAEGELHIGGNVDVASGATVKASIEGANVTVKRLQIEDGASLNGHVRMGSFEQSSGG